MFQDTTTLALYGISVLTATMGLVMLLIGKNNPRTKRYGLWILVGGILLNIGTFFYAVLSNA